MDEIDAALDFKNVSIVAHYIKVYTCTWPSYNYAKYNTRNTYMYVHVYTFNMDIA